MIDNQLAPICQKVLTFCRQPTIVNKPLTVAYSGGIDSQVLLHVIAVLIKAKLLSVPVRAIHINHGLSDNATSWQAFCKQQADQFKVPFLSVQVTIDSNSSESLEALARTARYQALQQNSAENAVIITGHHQDDQVETLLLALKRGAGIQGLAAMQSLRKMDPGSANTHQQLLARPLLDVSRDDIEHYATRQNLTWVEDESNNDQRFDRNFIRSEVVPLLKNRWPAIQQTISRSASHCQQAQHLLNELAAIDYLHCQISSDCLAITEMANLSDERITNLLRYFIKNNGGEMPSMQQLQQIKNACFIAANDKNPEINFTHYSIRRFRSWLYFTANFAITKSWQKDIKLNELAHQPIELPDSLGTLIVEQLELSALEIAKTVEQQGHWLIKLPENATNVRLAFTHNNPKCLPDYRSQRRELKKILQEQAIPTWQRTRLPFVFIDQQLSAVLPLFVCKEYLAQPTKNNIHCLSIIWHQ